MKTSIEIVTDANSPHIHFVTTNVEVDDSPITNKNLNEIAIEHGNISVTNFFKDKVRKEFDKASSYTITGIYLHNSIIEIDFFPKEVKDFNAPADKKPEFKNDNYKQYIFDEGELKDVPSELLDEAKKVRDEFVKWFNEYTENKVPIKESVVEDLADFNDIVFTVALNLDSATATIAYKNSVYGSDAQRFFEDIYSKDALLNAISKYLDTVLD